MLQIGKLSTSYWPDFITYKQELNKQLCLKGPGPNNCDIKGPRMSQSWRIYGSTVFGCPSGTFKTLESRSPDDLNDIKMKS